MCHKVIVALGRSAEHDLGAWFRLTAKGGTCVLTAMGGAVNTDTAFDLSLSELLQKNVQGSLSGGGNPHQDIREVLALYKLGDLDLDDVVTGPTASSRSPKASARHGSTPICAASSASPPPTTDDYTLRPPYRSPDESPGSGHTAGSRYRSGCAGGGAGDRRASPAPGARQTQERLGEGGGCWAPPKGFV